MARDRGRIYLGESHVGSDDQNRSVGEAAGFERILEAFCEERVYREAKGMTPSAFRAQAQKKTRSERTE